MSNRILPGTNILVKDGNLASSLKEDIGNSVLLIAPTGQTIAAADQVVTPKRIRSYEELIAANLGTYSPTNTLARKWQQLYDAQCRYIYVLPLAGTTTAEKYECLHKIYSTLELSFDVDTILLAGISADTPAITMATLPEDDYILRGQTYQKNETATTVNITSENATSVTLTGNPVYDDEFVVTVDDSTLGEGSGYTVDKINKTLTIVNPSETCTGTIVYKTYDITFAAQLAGFCQAMSTNNDQVLGVMGVGLEGTVPADFEVTEPCDLSVVPTYMAAQKQYTYNRFLQIIGGSPCLFTMGSKIYADTVDAPYAALISTLPSYSAPTNKVIPGAIKTYFNLSTSQILALTDKHIVCPRLRNNEIVIADAITTAPDNSDFVRLTTVRIMHDAVNLTKSIAEKYIGEPNTLAYRSSLETAVRAGLDKMVEAGALNKYEFMIKATLDDQINGNLRIILNLVPVFETRNIFVTVAVKPEL